MLTDPIADMLTRIRNAILARKEAVEIPSSKLKVRIADVLKTQGFIKNFHVVDDDKQGMLYVSLKWMDSSFDHNVIQGLKRVSRPGRRVYVKSDGLPRVLNGLGVAILSTSQGVLTDKQARKGRIGGEYICAVW